MYRWWVLLHIVGVAGFLMSHGVSMFVLFRIRATGLDRDRILDYATLSGQTTGPMYVFLAMLLVGGVAAGVVGKWFSYLWIWGALVVLVITMGAMYGLARPYMAKVKAACEVRPSGVPRVSDEELGQILRGPTTQWISAVGMLGLLIILYLMVFKPGV